MKSFKNILAIVAFFAVAAIDAKTMGQRTRGGDIPTKTSGMPIVMPTTTSSATIQNLVNKINNIQERIAQLNDQLTQEAVNSIQSNINLDNQTVSTLQAAIDNNGKILNDNIARNQTELKLAVIQATPITQPSFMEDSVNKTVANHLNKGFKNETNAVKRNRLVHQAKLDLIQQMTPQWKKEGRNIKDLEKLVNKEWHNDIEAMVETAMFFDTDNK